jgi:PAS domain S-box-containing protein
VSEHNQVIFPVITGNQILCIDTIWINISATFLGASHSDEIIGKNVLDFIQPEFRDTVRKNIEINLEGQITPTIELHMLRVDGTSVLVEGRGVRTFIDGKPAIQVAIRELHYARTGRNSIQRRDQ